MVEYHIVMLECRAEAAEMMRTLARELGAELSRAKSPEDALALDADVLVVELSGAESITTIGTCSVEGFPPIVAVVAEERAQLVERAAAAGAAAFITLPPQMLVARTTLEMHCRSSRNERAPKLGVRATLPYDTDLGGWVGLVMSAPNVILRVGVSGRVEFANRAIVEGLEPSGRLITDVGIPNLGPAFMRQFHDTVRLGQPVVVETSGAHPTLGHRDYTVSLGPITGNGSTSGVAVVLADVTEQRVAERALRENQEQFVALVETAPDYISILDADGVVLFINRGSANVGAERIVGLSMDSWLELGQQDFRTAIAATLSDDGTHDLRFKVAGRWFEARMRRVLFEGQYCVLLFSSDVTGRVEADRALRSTAGRVELLLRNLPLIVFEIEVSWQDGLEVGEMDITGTVAGHRMEELSVGEFAELIHPDDMPAMLETWSNFARGDVDHWSHEYRVIGTDGSTHWLLGRGTRVAPQRMLGFSLDITERRDLESKLVHAGKMEAVGRLAGGVAHDFNNLLTSIVNFTWYVRDELPSGSPLREDLGEVLKAAESGARLTSQLLAFSRRKPAEATVVELNERVDQMRRVLERTIGENIRLEFRRSPQILPAIIDPGQFDQLVFNLAVNARDAMPGGGTLVFDLRAENDQAVMEVVDDGTGIPRDIQDQLFEPFFSTKGENGTGLGLATCYGIARQAGGEIVVESQQGQGAKFVVRLPLATIQNEPSTEEESRVAPRTNAPSVALVVEDQPAILKLVRRALEHAGWAVHTVASAEEAIEIAAGLGEPPGVLLTDVVLPGRSGVELTGELRERWPELPALLVSGYLGDEFEPAMSARDRTAFLPKPFNSVQLVSKLAVLLGE